jgi:hypothetical protein
MPQKLSTVMMSTGERGVAVIPLRRSVVVNKGTPAAGVKRLPIRRTAPIGRLANFRPAAAGDFALRAGATTPIELFEGGPRRLWHRKIMLTKGE